VLRFVTTQFHTHSFSSFDARPRGLSVHRAPRPYPAVRGRPAATGAPARMSRSQSASSAALGAQWTDSALTRSACSVRTGHAHPLAFRPPALTSERPWKLSSSSSYEGIYLICCDCTVQAITTRGPGSAVQTTVAAEARARRRRATIAGEADRSPPSLVPPIRGHETRSISRRTNDRSCPALLAPGAGPHSRRISLDPGHDSTNLSVRLIESAIAARRIGHLARPEQPWLRLYRRPRAR
jgi:hypothetical protein